MLSKDNIYFILRNGVIIATINILISLVLYYNMYIFLLIIQFIYSTN